jgi:DNA-directed RNA polymerase specialized sigma24 family protein
MLGSLAEADDAVQETWVRLSRSGGSGVDSLGAWLTTVVARACLDMLRSRKSRREDPLDAEEAGRMPGSNDPEQELLLANSVGLALLVILDTLEPVVHAWLRPSVSAITLRTVAPPTGSRGMTAA